MDDLNEEYQKWGIDIDIEESEDFGVTVHGSCVDGPITINYGKWKPKPKPGEFVIFWKEREKKFHINVDTAQKLVEALQKAIDRQKIFTIEELKELRDDS